MIQNTVPSTSQPDWIHSLATLVLMPHSGCNCRCVMCDIWKANRNNRELSEQDIAIHLDEVRMLSPKVVTLSGGEAIMSQNIWKLCRLLRSLETKISLMSTGILLARNAGDVVSWCDAVTVSLDGTREVHDSIRRVPRAFERLAEGVAAIKNLKPTFPIVGRCVVQRANYRELPAIISTAKTIRLDIISFLPADVSSEAFNRPAPWSDVRISEIALSRSEVTELAQIIEQVIESNTADFSSGFIYETPANLRRLPSYFAALNGDGDFPATICNAPWVSAVVEADLTVRPCYFHRPIGNIKNKSLVSILNSDEALAFRRSLDVTQDPVCKRCVCPMYIPREIA